MDRHADTLMPSFEITSPDGKKYRVNGPEGATQEQAYDILRGQLGGGGDKPTAAEPQGQGTNLGIGEGATELGRIAMKQGGEFLGGVPRGITNAIVRLGSALPGAELPGLTPEAIKAHREATTEAKQYAEGGGEGWANYLGKATGELAPFVVAPEAGFGLARMGAQAGGRVAPVLGRIAENAAYGGEAGALYSDDPAKGAWQGAAAGAATPIAGRAMQGASRLARSVGHYGHLPGWWLAHHFLGPVGTFGYPLAWIAARAGRPAGRLVGSGAGAAAAGTVAGERNREDPDERENRSQP